MKEPADYSIVAEGLTSPRDAPKGQDIWYRCTKCSGFVPSQPQDNVSCTCGNIAIDVDYCRLDVDDFTHFQVVRSC